MCEPDACFRLNFQSDHCQIVRHDSPLLVTEHQQLLLLQVLDL